MKADKNNNNKARNYMYTPVMAPPMIAKPRDEAKAAA